MLLMMTMAVAGTWPPGAVIEDAAVLDVTGSGFDAVAGIIPALLPSAIEIPATESTYDLFICDVGFGLLNGAAGIQVLSARIVPMDGYLDITAELLVNVNDAGNQFALNYDYCFGDDTCNGYIDAFPVTIHTIANMEIVTGGDGQPALDATIGDLEVTYGLEGSYIHLDCWIQGLEDVLSFVGLSLYDLIIGLLAPTLESTIADIVPELEATIEDAFSAAVIQQDVDLNGATLHVNLFPSDIDITTDGLRLSLSGAMDADAASCIAAYDPGGSAQTDAPVPGASSLPAGTHMGLLLSDDFINQALYAAWRGGILCISTDTLELPITLDTGLMGSLTGNVFTDLFPEPKPVSLRTVPRTPLTAAYDGPHDVDVNIQDLDLEFYAELDGREARIVDVSLDGLVGADFVFDAGTGNLAIALALSGDDLTPSIVYNELKPDDNDAIITGFQGSFGSLVETLIGSLVGDSLSFALPSFSGLGLQSIDITGDTEWLTAAVQIGLVSYGSGSGCGADGGCGGCSGGSGCSVGGVDVPIGAFWIPGLAFLVVRRRRQ